MQKHEAVTNRQSWQSVCAGIVLSIITPNQVGDIVGKAIYLQSFDKIKGAVVSLLGGLAQTIASVTFGLLSIWWLAYGPYRNSFPIIHWWICIDRSRPDRVVLRLFSYSMD
jgi:hypothetical protein